MLEASLKDQLKVYLAKIVHPVVLTASLDGGVKSRDLLALLEDIAALSDKITLDPPGNGPRTPAFTISRPGTAISLGFAGLPMGHEFNSLVLALLHVGGHPVKAEPEVIAQIEALEGEYRFETYFSLSCQNCPDVIQALNLMSVVNPRIRHVAIDGALFPDEVAMRQVMAVPAVFRDGQPFAQGRMTVEQILAKLDSGAEARAAEKLAAQAPFEVLVVGGGPAGAAAAIYAARKGIRTGILAERFGGQVQDTLGIENLIAVPHTEGPKLAAQLEAGVKANGVEVMNLQRVAEVIPAARPGGLIAVRTASGATLKTRALILATGARWRTMNVPGEAEYRNKGVAFCPHCDGPLFKGKRVAVIGGGNSGVEAAIDLAGIVGHVTVIEYDSRLRADAVLQDKLAQLANVGVVTSAMTTEVRGDGDRVTGLDYVDRLSGALVNLDLDGVFVQIGLVPNTEFLKDVVALTPRGEIVVDARGETGTPGVFAAGDATTSPFKQIVIAMGDGAKASLAAFDYLIRHAPENADTDIAAAE